MKKFRKVLALTLCAAALVGASVMGTMAYLTDNDEVTNTFTVGNVDITLNEAKVDVNGKKITGDRVQANSYKLLPGGEYDKDPTVTVEDGSEDAYVRMLVTVSDIDALKEAFGADYVADDVFLLEKLVDWDSTTWVSTAPVKTVTTGEGENSVMSATYEFRYAGNDTENKGYLDISGATDANTAIGGFQLPALFTTITIPGEGLTNTEIAKLQDVQITVTAEAIQAAGFEDATKAWTAFDKEMEPASANNA